VLFQPTVDTDPLLAELLNAFGHQWFSTNRVRKKGRLRRWAVLVCPGMVVAVGGLGWG